MLGALAAWQAVIETRRIAREGRLPIMTLVLARFAQGKAMVDVTNFGAGPAIQAFLIIVGDDDRAVQTSLGENGLLPPGRRVRIETDLTAHADSKGRAFIFWRATDGFAYSLLATETHAVRYSTSKGLSRRKRPAYPDGFEMALKLIDFDLEHATYGSARQSVVV
jgi:hypothetical protein